MLEVTNNAKAIRISKAPLKKGDKPAILVQLRKDNLEFLSPPDSSLSGSLRTEVLTLVANLRKTKKLSEEGVLARLIPVVSEALGRLSSDAASADEQQALLLFIEDFHKQARRLMRAADKKRGV